MTAEIHEECGNGLVVEDWMEDGEFTVKYCVKCSKIIAVEDDYYWLWAEENSK